MGRIKVRRREFLLALLALGVPPRTHAQAPARVGWLSLHSVGMYHEVTSRGFVKGLREAVMRNAGTSFSSGARPTATCASCACSPARS